MATEAVPGIHLGSRQGRSCCSSRGGFFRASVAHGVVAVLLRGREMLWLGVGLLSISA